MTGGSTQRSRTRRGSTRRGREGPLPRRPGRGRLLLEIYPPLRDLVQENRAFVPGPSPGPPARGSASSSTWRRAARLPRGPPGRAGGPARSPGRLCRYRPVVLSHARALLARRRCGGGRGGPARPRRGAGRPELRAVIDPAEPVCVILGAVLHFLDAGTAREVTAGYARLIAPGSCLVISCATYDDEALAKRLAAEYTAGQFVNHTREDVVSFFAGLELVGPGVTEAQTWRAWMPQPVLRHREGHVLAGVARRQA